MYSFDIDGVVSIGIAPGSDDVIITGRSYEEWKETRAMLEDRGIFNQVFYNPLRFDEKSRHSSAEWKAKVINSLGVKRHFEDDPLQIEILRAKCHNCYIVEIVSDLTELENVRRTAQSD